LVDYYDRAPIPGQYHMENSTLSMLCGIKWRNCARDRSRSIPASDERLSLCPRSDYEFVCTALKCLL